MTMQRLASFGLVLLGALGLGCEPRSSSPTIDSQTNWLKACEADSECGEFTCVCGVCTTACAADDACSSLDHAECVVANEPAAIAQCGGVRSARYSGLCLTHCDATNPCGEDLMCVAGVCSPVPNAEVEVTIDTSAEHQTLTGFGSTLAYGETQLTVHPQKAALYKAMFAELGLDVLRIRNRFGKVGDDDLAATSEVIDAASTSLGRTPTVFMSSWSPPAAMKANADEQCSGNAETCTLAKTPGGTFDYDSYATYWRDSLDAYAAAGITPDYIGLQNNPDWLPAEPSEACFFLPTEGTKNVIVAGVSRMVEYPGLAEAQDATVATLDGLAKPPKLLAPETSGLGMVSDYVSELDLGGVDAFSHHLYGIDPQEPDLEALSAAGELAAASGKPVFQTEMGADGLGTALLIHYSTVVEGAAAYLQAAFYSSATGPGVNTQALLSVDDTTFAVREPYYAMQHYARSTDPGWVRVDANASADTVLASAWRSPDDAALTVVLVNPGNAGVAVQLNLPDDVPTTSTITRTAFGGLEHAVMLGSLSSKGILKVPPRAIVTVAFGE